MTILKEAYASPEILTIELTTDRLMTESPVTGGIEPAPWDSDSFGGSAL